MNTTGIRNAFIPVKAGAAVGGIVALALLVGCDQKNEAEDRAKLAGMGARIDEMIDDRSCSESGSCRVIAFGVKPCGGPWEYKLYSAEYVDTLALQKAVREYNDFNREANERHGWTSDCSVTPVPSVTCFYGTCEFTSPP